MSKLSPLWTLEQANQLRLSCKASVGNSQRATFTSIPPLVKQNLSSCSRRVQQDTKDFLTTLLITTANFPEHASLSDTPSTVCVTLWFY